MILTHENIYVLTLAHVQPPRFIGLGKTSACASQHRRVELVLSRSRRVPTPICQTFSGIFTQCLPGTNDWARLYLLKGVSSKGRMVMVALHR